MGTRRRVIGLLALAGAIFASLAPAVTSGDGAALPSVDLAGGSSTTAGKSLSFAASTDAKLTGAGGNLELELRGIDLTRSPRATYARPDYAGKRCGSSLCRWVVVRGISKYEFTAFLVDRRNGKSVGQSRPVRAVWAKPPLRPPQDVKYLINGTKLRSSELEKGTDNYLPIRPGRLQVGVSWTGKLNGTYVLITDSSSKTTKTCSTGTSCVATRTARVRNKQEMSWSIQVLTLKGRKMLSNTIICLVGKL